MLLVDQRVVVVIPLDDLSSKAFVEALMKILNGSGDTIESLLEKYAKPTIGPDPDPDPDSESDF